MIINSGIEYNFLRQFGMTIRSVAYNFIGDLQSLQTIEVK